MELEFDREMIRSYDAKSAFSGRQTVIIPQLRRYGSVHPPEE